MADASEDLFLCLKCKVGKKIENREIKITRNHRHTVIGNCVDCHSKVSKFIKTEDIDECKESTAPAASPRKPEPPVRLDKHPILLK